MTTIRQLAGSPAPAAHSFHQAKPAKDAAPAGFSRKALPNQIADAAGRRNQNQHQINNRNAALAGQLVVAGDYFKLGSLLYQKVLDPNVRTANKNNSLLHTAFGYINDHLNLQLVTYELLASGADVNARNKAGLTPLDVAMSRTKLHPPAIDHLLHFGARITPAAQHRAMQMAQRGEPWLLNALRDPQGRQANPPLHAPHAYGPFV